MKSRSLADAVFERLEDDILGGKYQKGDILTELKLSSELEVSRTPVREAFRRLQQEGLVKESGKGMEVIGIDLGDLLDIYDIRKKTEGVATRKCAGIITDAQLSELAEIIDLQDFYTRKAASDQIKKTDSSFHEKIFEYCGSAIYASILTSLHRKAQKFRKISVSNNERAMQAAKEHRAILAALTEHNGELAERLTVEHIKNAEKNILKSIKSKT